MTTFLESLAAPASERWDGEDHDGQFGAYDAAQGTDDPALLRAALRTAIGRLGAYQLECRHLVDSYLAQGMDPVGFCRGSIFEKTFDDILAVLSGGPER